MPAVPGKGGQVPKRSSQLMGHRSKADMASRQKVPVKGKVTIPPADKEWHPIARNWYLSLKDSGQSQFFEPSDWTSAQLVAESMHRCLDNGGSGLSASLFSSTWAAMNDLLSTEGSRRRLRLELERNQAQDTKSASATAIANYRTKLAA